MHACTHHRRSLAVVSLPRERCKPVIGCLASHFLDRIVEIVREQSSVGRNEFSTVVGRLNKGLMARIYLCQRRPRPPPPAPPAPTAQKRFERRWCAGARSARPTRTGLNLPVGGEFRRQQGVNSGTGRG
eukprot:1176776-Prorocentrum_minimum.AAC.2